MLRKNILARKCNTGRYIRAFRHIYNKWSILIIQYKSKLNLHLLYMNIYEYILLSNWIYIYILSLTLSLSLSLSLSIYIYIYIWTLCFLFIATLSQLIRTMVTLVWDSYDLFQLVLLVEAAYTIVNMIQVITKEARAT